MNREEEPAVAWRETLRLICLPPARRKIPARFLVAFWTSV